MGEPGGDTSTDYLAEGRVFFGEGKVVYGDQHDGDGLHADDFFYQLGGRQQRRCGSCGRE